MNEQWEELKETIIELRDNDGTGTQQEVCKFLVNYMEVLEKGTAPQTLTECDNEDAEIYSDVFEIDADYLGHDVTKVRDKE